MRRGGSLDKIYGAREWDSPESLKLIGKAFRHSDVSQDDRLFGTYLPLMPSSSTSNTSVAFGGTALPAPRSP